MDIRFWLYLITFYFRCLLSYIRKLKDRKPCWLPVRYVRFLFYVLISISRWCCTFSLQLQHGHLWCCRMLLLQLHKSSVSVLLMLKGLRCILSQIQRNILHCSELHKPYYKLCTGSFPDCILPGMQLTYLHFLLRMLWNDLTHDKWPDHCLS